MFIGIDRINRFFLNEFSFKLNMRISVIFTLEKIWRSKWYNDMVYNIYCVFREIFLHRQQFVENSEIVNFPLQNFVNYISLCYVAKYNTKDMLF